jgi:sugar phosphate isomerase/epimerase
MVAGRFPNRQKGTGWNGIASVLCFYCRAHNPSPTGKTVLIACSSAAFPLESLDSALRRIAWAGFEAVELDFRGTEPPDAEEVRARLRAEGLETAAIFAGTAPAGVEDDALTQWGRIGRLASLARELDCGHIVVAAPESGTLAGLRDGLALLDRALKDLPVDVCLVHRSQTLLSTPGDLTELWRLGVPGRVHLSLDPAQAELAGWDPLDRSALPMGPDHVYWSDLRDGRVVPPGEGELPLFALADSLMATDPSPRSLTVSLENADPWRVEPLAREVYRQTVVQFEIQEAP